MGTKLSNQSISLRILTEEAAPMLLDYMVRNRAFLEPWSPKRNDDYFTLRTQQQILKAEFDLMKKRRLFRFYIFKNNDENRIIGNIGFSNIIYGPFQSCFVGYSMDEQENGKGYTREALEVGIRFIFEEIKLHRIEANIMPRNHRSVRLAKGLGFVKEGLSTKYLKINGVWEDHERYALLNPNNSV